MIDVSRLLRENVTECGLVDYEPSKRLTNEDGKPQVWKIRPLTNEEMDRLTEANITKIYDKRTGRLVREEPNTTGLSEAMAQLALVEPSKELLEQKEVQDSWGVFTPWDVVRAMLSPGEYADLLRKVQEVSGFEAFALNNLVKETKKNSTKETPTS